MPKDTNKPHKKSQDDIVREEKIQAAREAKEALAKNPERYAEVRREYFSKMEACENGCYPDHEGNATVGIGFNMDAPSAREQWKQAFANAKDKPDFDKVKSKKQRLTKDQITALFNVAVESRVEELKRSYGDAWDKLKPNEKLAIEDLYYNGPSLVSRGTCFHENIQCYVATGDRTHLEHALWEVAENSNPKHHAGMQNRREAQTMLLNTYDADRASLKKPEYSEVFHDQRKARKMGKKVVDAAAAIGDELRTALAGVGTSSDYNTALPGALRDNGNIRST